MAADSDGLGSAGGGSCGVVVTCEGDLRDPRFPARLRRLLRDLRTLLAEPHPNTLKVNKVEPWNSVRVTLSVPRAAAARLRALAAAGAPQLRALGILSVQLDGDAAVSLRLQHGAELRINTDPDDASTSRSTPNPEVLSSLGTIGRLLADDAGASTSGEASRDNFKSPNTVCPMDGKIPLNIPTHSNERCEFPFGSMTQARVIHRKENTLGITGPTGSIRPPADGPFARPSTSTFPGPPPPYPAPAGPPAPPTPPAAPAPTVAMSSPLLVNLLQNDAPAPQPRSKPPHPAKLDRLEDGQVELAVGRPPFAEYRVRAPPSPSPPASPLCAPRARPPMLRRAAPAHYRARAPFAPPDAPPPPYRTAPPRPRAAPRVTQEDLQALLPPTAATMDQKTQSSFQEFQRYQQQYVARQRAASRGGGGADWNEPYRDSLSLLDLPDSDLEHLMPTLGDVLNMDDSAFSAMSDLDAAAKLDLLLAGGASATPDSLFQDITGESYGGDIPELQAMPPPPPPVSEPQVVTSSPVAVTSLPVAVTSSAAVAVTSLQPAPALTRVPLPPTTLPIRPVIQPQIPRLPPPPPPLPPETLRGPINPPVPLLPLPRVHTATVGSQASAKEIEEQNKRYLIKTLMRDDASPPPDPPKPEVPEVKLESPVPDPIEPIDSEPKRPDDDRGENEKRLDDDSKRPRKEVVRPRTPRDKRDKEPEKESIKLRLKLDKNEPVVQPVYKADVTFLNPPKPDAELRVPPLHISLRGRNSAVIKNSRKEKKKLTPSDPHKKVKSRKSSESDERHRDDGSEVTEASPDPQDLPLNNHVTDPPPEDGVVFRMKTISKNAHIVTKHDYKTNNRVSLDVKPKKKLKILTESKLPERERDKEWRTELDEEGKYAHNEGYRETDGPPVPTVPDEHSDTVQSDALETGVIGEKTGALNDTGVSNDTTGASDTDSKLLKCDEKVEWTHGHGPEPTDTCPDSGTDGPAPARTDPEVTRNDSDDKVVPVDVVGDDSVKRTSNDEEAERTNDTDNNLKRTVDGEGKVTRTIDAETPSVPNGVLPDKRRKACAAACPAASPPRSPTSPRRRERVKDKSYCKLVAERAARPHEDKFGGRSPSQAQGEDSGIESMDALSEKSPNQASQSPPAPPRLPPALRHYEPALRDIEAELADLHGEPDSYDKLPPAPPAPQPPAPPPTPPDLTRMPLKADFPDKSLLEQLLIEIPASEYPRGSSASPAARSTVRTRSAARLASPGLPPKGAPRRRRRDSDPPPDGAASPSRRKRARPPPAAAPGPRRKDSDSDSDEPLICKVRGTAGAGRGRGVVTRRAARAPAPRRATRSGDAPRPAD